jgi:hypothetical protein
MSREPPRGTPRSVANLEFHHAGHKVNEVCAEMVAAREEPGIRAVNPAMAFPMEMDQYPSETTEKPGRSRIGRTLSRGQVAER